MQALTATAHKTIEAHEVIREMLKEQERRSI
jgi:hypothetical protein